MSIPRIRATNFSKEEELSLITIITKYKDIIESKNTNFITPQQRENAWNKVLLEFNSSNRHRLISQLKSKFDNLKTAAKKFAVLQKNCQNQTGGGPYKGTENVLYELVLEILNKKTVFGLENTYDSDKPQDNLQSNSIDVIEEMADLPIIIATSSNVENKIETSNSNIIIEEKEEEQVQLMNESWTHYTPQNLRQPINKKLNVTGKCKKSLRESRSLYEMKLAYIQQKTKNLISEDRRKEELHKKQMELLELQINYEKANK